MAPIAFGPARSGALRRRKVSPECPPARSGAAQHFGAPAPERCGAGKSGKSDLPARSGAERAPLRSGLPAVPERVNGANPSGHV